MNISRLHITRAQRSTHTHARTHTHTHINRHTDAQTLAHTTRTHAHTIRTHTHQTHARTRTPTHQPTTLPSPSHTHTYIHKLVCGNSRGKVKQHVLSSTLASSALFFQKASAHVLDHNYWEWTRQQLSLDIPMFFTTGVLSTLPLSLLRSLLTMRFEMVTSCYALPFETVLSHLNIEKWIKKCQSLMLFLLRGC